MELSEKKKRKRIWYTVHAERKSSLFAYSIYFYISFHRRLYHLKEHARHHNNKPIKACFFVQEKAEYQAFVCRKGQHREVW